MAECRLVECCLVEYFISRKCSLRDNIYENMSKNTLHSPKRWTNKFDQMAFGQMGTFKVFAGLCSLMKIFQTYANVVFWASTQRTWLYFKVRLMVYLAAYLDYESPIRFRVMKNKFWDAVLLVFTSTVFVHFIGLNWETVRSAKEIWYTGMYFIRIKWINHRLCIEQIRCSFVQTLRVYIVASHSGVAIWLAGFHCCPFRHVLSFYNLPSLFVFWIVLKENAV